MCRLDASHIKLVTYVYLLWATHYVNCETGIICKLTNTVGRSVSFMQAAATL